MKTTLKLQPEKLGPEYPVLKISIKTQEVFLFFSRTKAARVTPKFRYETDWVIDAEQSFWTSLKAGETVTLENE